MPAEGIPLISHQDILRLEEMVEFTRVAVESGINKVRITGGEPLLRKNICGLVRMLSEINGIIDLSMTTNAVLLKNYAEQLKSAGLMRVNISLDTLNAEKYRQITRGGNIEDVKQGINSALEAGLFPVKVNCVVNKSSSEEDAAEVGEYCGKLGIQARFIPLMDLESGKFGVVEGGSGGECLSCNRIRLSSDGKLRPCLFDDRFVDVRRVSYNEAIRQVIEMKPECGTLSKQNHFNSIGG